MQTELTVITKTLILEPKVCPSCAGEITLYEDSTSNTITHTCTNVECPGRLVAYLGYVASRDILEIEELGPETITKLVNDGYVLSLPDLLEFTDGITKGIEAKGEEAVASKLTKLGYSGALLIKMAKSMERVKTRDWDKWLAALGIPGIAKSLSKMLAMNFRLGPNDIDILPSLLSKGDYSLIEGIGAKKEAELRKALPALEPICKALYEAGVRPKSLILAASDPTKVLPLAGYVLCITGEFDKFGEREHIQKCLTSVGAVCKTGVSRKLTHLIAGDGAGQSKLGKARELGLPIVKEEWLKAMFSQNHLQLNPKSAKFETEWDDI